MRATSASAWRSTRPTPRLKPPRNGTFQVGGVAEDVGRLTVATVIPQLAQAALQSRHHRPHRHPHPQRAVRTSAIAASRFTPGQRITARNPLER